ncbi:MAG: metalloregulator ArsR/SmtB family transcription factor [bacterium]|nr:metalloregulator ArsR/SmtB family transcription factor [bacterium]
MKTEKIDEKRLAVLFDALSDQMRLNIFRVLLTDSDICVSEIARKFSVSVPAVSQQLKILERGGFVERIRRGQKVCYTARKGDTRIRSLISLVRKYY